MTRSVDGTGDPGHESAQIARSVGLQSCGRAFCCVGPCALIPCSVCRCRADMTLGLLRGRWILPGTRRTVDVEQVPLDRAHVGHVGSSDHDTGDGTWRGRWVHSFAVVRLNAGDLRIRRGARLPSRERTSSYPLSTGRSGCATSAPIEQGSGPCGSPWSCSSSV
jgi:hypothetical protein